MTPLAKRLWIALAISITVNVLFVGVVVGRALHRPHPPFPGEREPRAFDGMREGKPGPLRGVFGEHADELRDKRRAIGDARRTARAALESEPFDRGALERALENLRKQTGSSQEVLHSAIVEAASKGSLDERRKLAHALERANLGRDVGRGPGPPRGR